MTDEERQERLRHHMYDTCEGIREQSERIVSLEELVLDLWHDLTDTGDVAEIYGHTRKYGERMRALGLEGSDG